MQTRSYSLDEDWESTLVIVRHEIERLTQRHLRKYLVENQLAFSASIDVSISLVLDGNSHAGKDLYLRVCIKPKTEVLFAILMGRKQSGVSRLRSAMIPLMQKTQTKIKLAIVHPDAKMEKKEDVH